MHSWFTWARLLPGTVSVRWHLPWPSVLPSALRGVGYSAARRLLLPSVGLSWGAPSSPAPHTARGAGWALRCLCSIPALLGCWRAACSGHLSLRASVAAAAQTLEACRLLAGVKWMVFPKFFCISAAELLFGVPHAQTSGAPVAKLALGACFTQRCVIEIPSVITFPCKLSSLSVSHTRIFLSVQKSPQM